MQIPRRSGRLSIAVATVLLLGITTSGFRLVSDQELEAIRSADQKPVIDPAEVFTQQILPWVSERAVPLSQVLDAIDAEGFGAACQEYGVQTSQAFPCIFWVKATGSIEQVERDSRVGRIRLDTGAEREVDLMIGPVIPGSAVRDGYPQIQYGDFSDQNSFANFADGLNQQVERVIAQYGDLAVGQTVQAMGAYASWDGMDRRIDIVPIALNNSEGR